MRTGYESLENRKKTAMVFSWQNQQNERDGWGIRMPSRGFDLRPLCGEFSVIRRRVSFRWFDGQKNGVWQLRESASSLVRPPSPPDSRFAMRRYAGVPGVRGTRRVLCRSCGKVKRERLEFLADNPFYTKRFAYYVGRRCRTATVQDIAKELKLDWHTVKELDKQYMKAQLAKAGKPRPKVIGVDEIAIRKGHTYRIVVSDLEKTRPIWFGVQDRSEESLTQFFAELGKSKSARIRLAVMDMWKPFRKATKACAPQAAILYDKFHVLRHLGEALDRVRKSEYGRLSGKDRRFIKGQKYTLLSHRDNLTL